ncbi:MAG: HAMP domain-containing histidine kinase [Planctomycetes bacterium]|nr:HAMP domain-containing histidine kinase [Planctomycetota bacterium]
MEHLLQTTSLTRRAVWLVKLRWWAIAVLATATLVAGRCLGVALPVRSLSRIIGLLLVYNGTVHGLLWYIRLQLRDRERTIDAILSCQISVDLMILTTILHYSGGIENPFLSFFVFHMIIASILCSRLQSYCQATLAMGLFGGIVWLEALGTIPHYSLTGFTQEVFPFRSPVYVTGVLSALAITLYLVVYLTTSIAQQLRLRQHDLTQANQDLEQKDVIKNQYVLRVTHDIKGHLAAIVSCLGLVHDETSGPLNDSQKDLTGRAFRRTNKCLEFVLALLKVTHMKLRGQIEVADFSMRTCIANAIGTVKQRAQDKQIGLHFELDETLDQYRGEAVMIEETIMNLLANAVKYTPEGGSVTMTVRDLPDMIELSVRDTGIGISESEQSRIFEEFFRAKNARAMEKDGTGLGLSFAQQIIERHGGTLTVQSRKDEGSTFTVTLSKQAFST